MFDTLQEHLDHSAPCASRWDGFDRGDIGRSYEDDIDWELVEFFENFVGPVQPFFLDGELVLDDDIPF